VQHVEEAVRRILRSLRSLLFSSLSKHRPHFFVEELNFIFGQELIIPSFPPPPKLDEGLPSFVDLKNVWIKD